MDTTATGKFSTGISYHTGLNENYREIILPANIQWDNANKTKVVTIAIDVKSIFRDGDSWINIREITEAHGPSDRETITKMVNNYQNAFKATF